MPGSGRPAGSRASTARRPTRRLAKPSRRARVPRLKKRASSSSVRASVATASTPPTRSPSSIATLRSMRASTRLPKFCRASASPAARARSTTRSAAWSSKAVRGVNTLSLRGLGATRTLILLNGRRIAPAGTRGQVGAADLNVLPNAILDRIEVLNTGASSIYGSDAVAGVVNIVTLSKFNGLAVEAAIRRRRSARARRSVTRSPPARRASVSRSSARSNCTIATASPRATSRGPAARSSAASQPARQPNDHRHKCFPLEEGGVTVNTIGTGFVPARHVDSDPVRSRAGLRADPAGLQPVSATAGVRSDCGRHAARCRASSASAACCTTTSPERLRHQTRTSRDTFAPSMLQQDIISPTRNYTGFLSGDLRHRTSSVTGSCTPSCSLPAASRSRTASASSRSTIRSADPLAPHRQSATAVALQALPRSRARPAFACSPTTASMTAGRRRTSSRLSGGFRGDLPFLPSWRYDVYAAKSWSDGTYGFEQILADRLQQSLDVAQQWLMATHRLQQTRPAVCVAAPAAALRRYYRRRSFRSVPTRPAWFDYVTEDVVGIRSSASGRQPDVRRPAVPACRVARLRRWSASSIASRASTTFRRTIRSADNLVRLHVGADHARVRTMSGKRSPSSSSRSCSNVPFAEELTVNVSGRYTDYKSYGSDTTYKIGGLYSPTRWLSFRGSYGTSYRAPALFEQFLGSTTGFLRATRPTRVTILVQRHRPGDHGVELPGGRSVRTASCKTAASPLFSGAVPKLGWRPKPRRT